MYSSSICNEPNSFIDLFYRGRLNTMKQYTAKVNALRILINFERSRPVNELMTLAQVVTSMCASADIRRYELSIRRDLHGIDTRVVSEWVWRVTDGATII